MSIITTIQAKAFLHVVLPFFASKFSITIQLRLRTGKGWTRGFGGLRNFQGYRFGFRIQDGIQNTQLILIKICFALFVEGNRGIRI